MGGVGVTSRTLLHCWSSEMSSRFFQTTESDECENGVNKCENRGFEGTQMNPPRHTEDAADHPWVLTERGTSREQDS